MSSRHTASRATCIVIIGLAFCLAGQARGQTCYNVCDTNEHCSRIGDSDTWK